MYCYFSRHNVCYCWRYRSRLIGLICCLIIAMHHADLLAVVAAPGNNTNVNNNTSISNNTIVNMNNSNNNNKSVQHSSVTIDDINRRAWPPMKHHDIWNFVQFDNIDNDHANLDNHHFDSVAQVEVDRDAGREYEIEDLRVRDEIEFISNNFAIDSNKSESVNNFKMPSNRNGNGTVWRQRNSKVLHLLPVPVDGECLADDGRRTGVCLNAYECHQKGGRPKGDCAMGFGVCCIFIANCNETISNNITYLVSPNFPSFVPSNFTSCKLKVKIMGDEISQLRLDFYHFAFGQPNRTTGICENDVFNVSGGPSGTFSLCGQNSGQHIYYDVTARSAPRQTLYGNLRPLTLDQLYPFRNGSGTNETDEQIIEISMNFSQRFLPTRLWEIRIAQIPFSQRAPAGCLQYHFGTEGIIQTFNFAENGRHLANQRYRICMRQEREMCSIMYEPCDEQSFRIGPSMQMAGMNNAQGSQSGVQTPAGSGGGAGSNGAGSGGASSGGTSTTTNAQSSESAPTTLLQDDMSSMQTMPTMPISSTAANTTAMSTPMGMTTTPAQADAATSTTAMNSTVTERISTSPPTAAPNSTTVVTTTEAIASSPLNDEVEGSGDDSPVTPSTPNVSRRPRPVSGGFDLLGFLRNTFDFGFRRGKSTRQGRQFFSSCTDRITMPCIVEDFIGPNIPGCEPVHCGFQFCSSGSWPCRIESTVTPFYIGVNFGNGLGKGSPDDNIGVCLRYTQMPCM